MSKVITSKELKAIIEEGKAIEYAAIGNAEGIKYDFRLGSKLLKSWFGSPVDIEKDLATVEQKNKAVVEPGEVVFVLSRERLNLPRDIYIQLSPKRSLSQDGIELLGGLTVDPGYSGYLVFGLKNVAGKPYKLKPDTKIVGANFFRLAEDEITEEGDAPEAIEDFPVRLQELIDKYEPVNPQSMAEELRNLQRAFEDSHSRLNADVGFLKEQVEAFTKELTRESVKREQETKNLSAKIDHLENKMESVTHESMISNERLENVTKTLTSVDERTKKIEEKIIGTDVEDDIRKKQIKGVVTTVVSVLVGIVVGVILFHIGIK